MMMRRILLSLASLVVGCSSSTDTVSEAGGGGSDAGGGGASGGSTLAAGSAALGTAGGIGGSTGDAATLADGSPSGGAGGAAGAAGSGITGLHVVMGSSGKPGHLEDENGKTVVLHGVDESGSENYCQTWGPPRVVLSPANGPSPLTQDSLTAMKQWGINAVRIPLNEDCWLGINGIDTSVAATNYQKPIVDAVNLITRTNSMYVILDLHMSAPGNSPPAGQGKMPDVDHSVTFWQQVAAQYKNNRSVIFDLFNEPNTGGNAAADWACWKNGSSAPNSDACPMMPFAVAGMQTLVTAVRQAGANNLLILGGVGYAAHLDLWPRYVPTDAISPSNIAASWHVYDDQGGCTNVPSQTFSTLCGVNDLGAQAVMTAGYPIVVGETGYYSCSASVGQSWWPLFLSWADAQGIGFFAWSWSDGNSPQLLSDVSSFTPGGIGPTYKSYLQCIASKTLVPATSCTFVPSTGCE